MYLSILIAAYNVEKYIDQCITSCLNQQFDQNKYEIIIVNDGSTDNTLNILQSHETKHKNITVLSQPNSGLGKARNRALEISKGKYIWFIDGDDFIEENILDKIIEKTGYDNLDILHLSYGIVINNELISVSEPVNKTTKIISGSEYYFDNYNSSYIFQYVIKRDILINNNIRFLDRINMQDSEIMPKILFHVNRFKYSYIHAYNYAQHELSFTNTNDTDKRIAYFKSIVTVRDSLQHFYNEIKETNILLSQGVNKKIKSIQEVVFSHLLYFKYDKRTFDKIISLLKANNLFPVMHCFSKKNNIIRWFLNLSPYNTYLLFNLIKKTKN